MVRMNYYANKLNLHDWHYVNSSETACPSLANTERIMFMIDINQMKPDNKCLGCWIQFTSMSAQ